MTHYDLVIIGAGSGNTILDDRFEHLRIAIIENGPFGGTCLNRGCIPSKMFIYPAEIADAARRGPALGVDTSFAGVDWPTIQHRVIDRVDGYAAGGQRYREGQEHIDVHTGTARFTGPREVVVDLTAGGTATVTGDQVVIAAGSRPTIPDLPGLHDVEHHTSDTIMRLPALPGRLGIIGGGYVGSEFAHLFSGYGTRVTQIARGAHLLGSHDADIARRFTEAVSQHWDVRVSTQVTRVAAAGDAIALTLSDGSTVEVDTLLLSIGRTSNTDVLEVSRAGVDITDAGLVVVDEHQRATAEGVWALGDISSPDALKHVANQDARVIQHNLLHPDDLVVSDHRFVPSAVFTSPQVASVGLTEAAAREKGLDVAVVTQSYADVAYGWAMQADPDDRYPGGAGGFVKLLADRSTGLLVGAHLMGHEASMLIQPLIQAMSFGQPVAGLAGGQYWIHPALTEVIENALLSLEKEL